MIYPLPAASPTIVLLTDFGLSDPYVGQMKGVLRALAPEATVVDLSHDVPAYGVETGAFFLVSSFRYFPEGTIFLTVVDPWVGMPTREILILFGAGVAFVGPDNGILSLAAENMLASGLEMRTWRLTNPPAPYVQPMGLTFAGRDIMAPLAAYLCWGGSPDVVGELVDLAHLSLPIWAMPEPCPEGVFASVLHVDHFGNVILNLTNQAWSRKLNAGDVWLVLPSASAQAALQLKVAAAYAELAPGKVGLVAGGQGYMELAMYQASAAAELKLKAGDLIKLEVSG